MIRLWLSREKSIPIREQLSAQLLLGILSRRLAPGQKLPSVRDLARRLKVHSNTVSAAYQDLAARGWVSQRRGSGVYVRAVSTPERYEGIDGFARAFLEEGLARGFTVDAVEAAMAKAAAEFRAHAAPTQLLVVDPDRELAHVLAAEIQEATGSVVSWIGLGEAHVLAPGVCVLSTAARAAEVTAGLRAPDRVIRLRSMEDVIAGQHRPAMAPLIAVVSRSASVLQWSATLLSALGFPGTETLQRNPANAGWLDGLGACDIVAADVAAAPELPRHIAPIVFRIVADDFLAEACELVTARKLPQHRAP